MSTYVSICCVCEATVDKYDNGDGENHTYEYLGKECDSCLQSPPRSNNSKGPPPELIKLRGKHIYLVDEMLMVTHGPQSPGDAISDEKSRHSRRRKRNGKHRKRGRGKTRTGGKTERAA